MQAYQPALDGLRGIAVAAVVAFHVGVLPGGFLGVEWFFVLSGFLITSLLINESQRSGTVGLRSFYARRAVRLAPALVLVLVANAAHSGVTNDPLSGIFGGLLSLFYIANWFNAFGGELGPLGHVWSLSIEEQFYLIWPLAVMGVHRYAKGSRFGWIGALGLLAAVIFVASSISRWIIFQKDPQQWFDRIYYGTDTRAAGLLIGCLAAALLAAGLFERLPPHAWQFAFVVWILPISGLIVANEQSPATYVYLMPLLDLTLALGLVSLVCTTGWITSTLSIRPARYLGQISYGIYLWHLPVLVYTTDLPDGLRQGIQILLPLVLSAFTYHLVERPIQLMYKRSGGSKSAPIEKEHSE